ncbi:MarR family transcriptional regulator [Mycolicibacterium madagascariense]|uniref:MarR family transcriptional regulator n=1 Tax=Mycolicibacterium madagascariense TaxID=212765 RepID=A0A7I7XF31_9MYCO|nr:MarR family transcriptional regulator [Mycolicibacterium madagascariense]MCV7011259.1 MarR family transcriptional regulator [Mycolicibacterium madagascariense]BBZ27800.1 MarR family transcriptional regulator [Mycolicibacterium madagascariense]
MSSVDVEGGAGYLVKRVQQSLRRRCDAALKPTGLSMAQYTALRALADHPDASASELARLCFVTRQSLQDLLGGLRAAGLVRASESASSRGRANALALTSAGRTRLAASHDAVIGVENAMLQGLSRGSRDDLAHLLTRCAENLED